MRRSFGLFVLGLGLLCALPAFGQFTVSDLSRLRNYESQRTSSYDRTGGNNDSSELKSGQELVLFNETGPAEIRHIWITVDDPEAYHLKKIVLRMYWDGEKLPAWKLRLEISLASVWGPTRYLILLP